MNCYLIASSLCTNTWDFSSIRKGYSVVGLSRLKVFKRLVTNRETCNSTFCFLITRDKGCRNLVVIAFQFTSCFSTSTFFCQGRWIFQGPRNDIRINQVTIWQNSRYSFIQIFCCCSHWDCCYLRQPLIKRNDLDKGFSLGFESFHTTKDFFLTSTCKEIFWDVPSHSFFFNTTIAINSCHSLWQFRIFADISSCLHRGKSDKMAIFFLAWNGCDCCLIWSQACRIRIKSEFTFFFSRFYNDNTFTIEGFSLPCTIFLSFITFTASLFSIVHTNDLPLPMKIEMNKIIGSWYNIAVFINDFIMDIRQIFAICSDNMFFLGETNSSWLPCCCHTITRNLFTIFITSNSS